MSALMELPEAELEALHGLISSLERRWHLPIPPSGDFHVYDPLPPQHFFPGIRVAMAHARERTFLDVGCGIGSKLLVMRLLGYDVAGIDWHSHYIEAARELCPDARLTCADIREVDEFDAGIVYMYRPGVSEETAAELERHVAERLRPGAVLFIPTRQAPAGCGLRRVGHEVWVK